MVEPFLNKTYVKIREYVDAKDGSYWSSPRGINLRVNEWKNLVKLVPEINAAVEEMDTKKKRKMETVAQEQPREQQQQQQQEEDTNQGDLKVVVDGPDPELQDCKELSFNIIQAIIVPCILKKVIDICKDNCFGRNLPMEDDVTQLNHECTMDSLSDKVGKYFFEALDEVASKELGKCRLEWNLKARENDKLASRFPTIFDTNRVFDEYVKMHVKIDPVSEHSVLFDVCYQES